MPEKLNDKLNAVIISDLHLNDVNGPLTQRFLNMLEVLPRYSERLYILGDLFEFWPGDDLQDDLSEQVVKALKTLSEKGVEIFFQRGNRDFLVGKSFAQKNHVHLLNDRQLETIGDQKILLMHGDLLCTDDYQYQRFRKVMHSSFLQWVWSHMPMVWRASVVSKVRKKSIENNSSKSTAIMDVNQQAVITTLQEFKVHTLIHGHTHRPDVHSLIVDGQPAQRWVLGDWGDDYWWIEVNRSNIHLCQSSIGSSFQPQHFTTVSL